MKITEITLNPQMVPEGDPIRFRIGTPVIEGGHIVEKILFCPQNNMFNRGREIATGCYTIYFENIPERRLIIADIISSVEVVKEQKDSTVPELPE